MKKQNTTRQTIRKALVLGSFLLLPITFEFVSPWIPMVAASRGIINGSLLIFAGLAVSAVFLGRAWCAWLCPGGGLEEVASLINNTPARGGKWDWIKWGIWIVWLGIIARFAISAGGYHTIYPLFIIDHGILTITALEVIIYYTILAIFIGFVVVAGKRSGCHYICWIAPFMIIGRKIGNALRVPGLRLKVEPEKCTDCQRCNKECQMSLDIAGMVKTGKLEHSECILCGLCVDHCPKAVITYAFSSEH